MNPVFHSADINRVADLCLAAGFDRLIVPSEPVALKIHFGEPGNTAYLKPEAVRPVAELVGKLHGKPFYTDCNTLYRGPRQQTSTHLDVARDHGYFLERAGADAVIPEESDQVAVEIKRKHFRQVYLGGPIARTGTLIALTHFKGHEVTGFGGTLKNLGMGCGTRLGKLKMHQDCPRCPESKTCRRNQTLEACWFGSSASVQERIVEYADGAVKGKRAGYVTFITAVSPACDCYPHNDPPIVPDLGVLVTTDPVASDQAAADLVNRAAGKDIFRALYPEVDWSAQLAYAESLGLGSRRYELVVK
ncbi:MAG: DUF362 domain-containing protein [Candidatus Margulisbacteria bacterium]|jgi:hypothetical protein|nr:DUF362 domain-containing protein [Candidatus Margulisiibacteriota bacterium]